MMTPGRNSRWKSEPRAGQRSALARRSCGRESRRKGPRGRCGGRGWTRRRAGTRPPRRVRPGRAPLRRFRVHLPQRHCRPRRSRSARPPEKCLGHRYRLGQLLPFPQHFLHRGSTISTAPTRRALPADGYRSRSQLLQGHAGEVAGTGRASAGRVRLVGHAYSALGLPYCVASQVMQRLTAARSVLPCVACSGLEGARRRHAPGEGVSTHP